MDIGIAIQDFITVHEIENHSPYTIRNYRRHLENFRAWVQSVHGIVDTDAIQVAHLRGWVSYLQKQAVGRLDVCMSDRTVNQYGVSLIAFCHWLEKEGIMEKSVTERFKLPRVEQKFVPTFTPDEVEKLLDACEEDKSLKPQLRKALTARNRAILSVLIDTGIRLSELVGLRLCDVDRDLRPLIRGRLLLRR